MGNLVGQVGLTTIHIDKGGVNAESLVDVFSCDEDFSGADTKKICKDIHDAHKDKDYEESDLLDAMVEDIFKVPNFIGTSDQYGNYQYEITDTDFEYIVSIAYIY